MINQEKLKQTKKRYYLKNKEKISEKCKEYYLKNKEKISEKCKEYYLKNKEKWNLTDKQKQRKKQNVKIWREKNKERLSRENKKRYWKNREKNLLQMKEYKKKNRKKMNEYKRKPEAKEKRNNHRRIREKENKQYNLTHRLRSRFSEIFIIYTKTGKVASSKKYGIDYKKIIEHLKPFPEDLSKYHIDHIKPLCSFEFILEDGSTNLEEVKKAFAPENHQWLLASENISKGGKWDGKR